MADPIPATNTDDFVVFPWLYFLHHPGETMELIRTHYFLVLAIVAITIIGVSLYYRKQITDLKGRLQLRDDEIKRLREQQAVSLPPSFPPSSDIFVIEHRFSIVKWKLKEVPGLPRPLLPDTILSDDATLILEVNTQVTAIPSLLVQNIQLEIMGNRFSEYDWKSQEVQSGTGWFYFPLPLSIPPGQHLTRLVATLPKNGSEIEERKFPPFEIVIGVHR
jgi:hypothetical protein